MSRKLSICHVITRMVVGGAQENTLYTIRGHLENGHQVTLITGESKGPEGSLLETFCPPGMKIIEVPEMIRAINPIKDLLAYQKLKKIFKENDYDVVHTHASKAGILGRLAADAAKVPFIVHTVHGQAFHPYQAAWKNKLYIFLEKYAAKHCHKIYAVAQAMIDQCVNAGVAKRSKYGLVYSGMELADFCDAVPDKKLRKELGIPANTLVVGKIARIFELKGYETLVEAAGKIVQEFPNLRFLIVGDGILRPTIEEEIEERGLQEYFVFTGLVPPSEVCKYTAQMDILTHLSLREGLPRTAVQALASSIPVVAHPLDGTPEVVLDGVSGYLCEAENSDEVAEAVLKLLKDPELRRKMGESGQQLVKKLFDWRVMADILEEEYYKGLRKLGYLTNE